MWYPVSAIKVNKDEPMLGWNGYRCVIVEYTQLHDGCHWMDEDYSSHDITHVMPLPDPPKDLEGQDATQR